MLGLLTTAVKRCGTRSHGKPDVGQPEAEVLVPRI